jgi:hypothetical protein
MYAGYHIAAAPVAVIYYLIAVGGNSPAGMGHNFPGLFQIAAPGTEVVVSRPCMQAPDPGSSIRTHVDQKIRSPLPAILTVRHPSGIIVFITFILIKYYPMEASGLSIGVVNTLPVGMFHFPTGNRNFSCALPIIPMFPHSRHCR